MSRLISKMSTMKKETNIKVEFITFYKFCVTEIKDLEQRLKDQNNYEYGKV